MTTTEITYTIKTITGVSLPYTYSDYGYSPIVNLIVQNVNASAQQIYCQPSFLFPPTLEDGTKNTTSTTNITYVSNNPTKLHQLPSGTYDVNMTYGKYNIITPPNSEPYVYTVA
jgi:hypothetical protein